MGAAFVNTTLRKVAGWLGAGVVMAVNVVLVWEASNAAAWTLWTSVPAVVGILAYISFIVYLVIGPTRCSIETVLHSVITMSLSELKKHLAMMPSTLCLQAKQARMIGDKGLPLCGEHLWETDHGCTGVQECWRRIKDAAAAHSLLNGRNPYCRMGTYNQSQLCQHTDMNGAS